MAPLPVPDALSSLVAGLTSASFKKTLIPRSLTHALVARATESAKSSSNVGSNYHPGGGITNPSSINNAFFIALFAILGAGMVIGSLWFFFWAKNGGFHFQEGDWDDYKSTVLRRKGPDGKTLSNATRSTKLGGGSSIAGTQRYKWQKQAAKSVVGRDEKGRKGILAKRGWANTHSILYSDDYMTESFGTKTVSDMTEVRTEYEPVDQINHARRYQDRDVDQYKKEKPARVGGINRVADGSHYNGSDTQTDRSDEPMLRRDREQQERAERKAREEAAKMERRWKREAELAAAALAAENTPTAPPAVKKSSSPSKPSVQKNRQPSSHSPRKSTNRDSRDFSYTSGPGSEVLSTAHTATTRTTSSYYDEYRAARSERESRQSGSRQSSPKKTRPAGPRSGGYRRGADSDLD
ncbi:Hypothetical protein R9X50_00783300 [Acrodontium crateriforme]|uniref:Endosomal spry domain-containing protein n=1 Tax=Acrodontium crateriforme TaxID=150365 RepID=A0AAQ3RCI9_9PEZI|nr:Hypothetical protein R9X50_00783300 [Acrodontium crateriforme]